MNKVEINLLRLDENTPKKPDRKQEQTTIRVLPSLLGFFAIGIVIWGATSEFSYQQSQNDTSALNSVLHSILFGSRPQFGETKDRALLGEQEDRINLLLLGVGGKDHDGPQLSDTNILLSVKPSTRSAAFISIPRDLLVPIEGYGWRKINNANAFAEMNAPGSGPETAAAVISKVLNVPVHYTLRVDFAGFSEIVDILGGLEIDVDKPFTDYSYPTDDYKYQTISFSAGPQTMDGARALMFVRSRHSGMNNEGSDFARSARQQKVITAVKEKVFSAQFLLNPQKINDVVSSLREHISTNIKSWELLAFLSLARSIDQDHILSFVFDDGPENFLTSSVVEGAYVLLPRDGTFEQMQVVVRDIFSREVKKETARKIRDEAPRVVVKNGTRTPGLAGRFASSLTKAGYTVVSIENAEQRDAVVSRLFSPPVPLKKFSRETLLSLLPSSTLIEDNSQATSSPALPPDFVIILGSDMVTGQDVPSPTSSRPFQIPTESTPTPSHQGQ